MTITRYLPIALNNGLNTSFRCIHNEYWNITGNDYVFNTLLILKNVVKEKRAFMFQYTILLHCNMNVDLSITLVRYNNTTIQIICLDTYVYSNEGLEFRVQCITCFILMQKAILLYVN